MKIVAPYEGRHGDRRVQELSLSLVVAEGGLEVFFFRMCKTRYLLFEKSINVTIFHVSNCHSISLFFI